ncbi:structural maintenance of chromosomes protein [Malassezia restricta]|uniref:structural maintenance of chromosomes protein n=1 Tax=Malassezia restricta TaxID=76775 RepID=UPI000DD1364E|nr:structural maintenance of chromosomes protein [Malassezia restricta]AXA51857.1 structural maintenance of chromosomes protein [Malassezia restricta]
MPLKHVEVENFKSYRGKQIIGPFNTFTSVIGPNGSGKSNLMDAISFVLGVRSVHLRASELKDLIYSENALNDNHEISYHEDVPTRASVMAVIEDTKHTEHRFQRIVNANASTEYRYNGRITTYASYNAKLEQLNILVKTRNFLVFQGDVESVAEQCSKDLSDLMDQISGSRTLKNEYDEARISYEEAAEQLTALVSKRKLLQNELRQVRQHKEAFDRFGALKNEVHNHTIQKILWRLYHINEIIEIHTDWIEAHASRGEQAQKRLHEKEQMLSEARSMLGSVQQKKLDLENERKQANRSLDGIRPEKDRLIERIEHVNRKLQQAQFLYKQAEKDHDTLKESLKRLESDAELVQTCSDKMKAEQEAALAATSIKLNETDLQNYHDLKLKSQSTVVQERSQMEQLQRKIREKQTSLDVHQDRIQDMESKLERLEQLLASLSETQAELATREPESAEKLGRAKSILSTLQSKKESISSREKQLNEALVGCYNRLLRMGQDQRVHEREARLRESLRSLRTIFPGVHGRLLDLCKPTQRKYELAIATALGRNAEAVVVNHEKTAVECIEYLRNQRAGQATFIPLDTIQTKPINDRLRSLSPQARLAIDVIQYAPVIERAVSYACGNAMVCDTLDVARNICYERAQRVKAVTLDGTIIHKTGMITGGPSMQETVKKWDDQELQGVQRERDRCMSELKELQQQKYVLEEEDELVASVTRAQASLQSIRAEQADVMRQTQDAQSECAAIISQKKKTQDMIDKLNEDMSQLRSQMSDIEHTIHAADDDIFTEFCERIGVANVREYEANQLHISQALNVATQQYQRQLARIAHQRTFAEQQLKNTADRLAFIQASMEKERQRIPRLEEELQNCENSIQKYREIKARIQASFEAMQEEHDEKTETVNERRKALFHVMRDVEAHRKEVAERNDEIAQLDTERANLFRRCRMEALDLPLESGDLANVPLEEDVSMPVSEADNAVQTCRQYDITVDFSRLSDAERTDRGSGKEYELQSRIDLAREEMEKLTPSTSTAERLDKLEKELKMCEHEIDSGREQVRESRDEFQLIKKQRSDLFMKAYHHIADRIDGVYKDLTKTKMAPMGGVAYLTLEDTDEPFRAGIRYHAMPPMKRFRDMDQLSGGEKTMAALALLFAIHTYQPAPFFVLDEVDAALDAQNVANVSHYIREHASDRFQFIVISLKASLYERSQGLVGVYRDQEAHSSASVTLDLEQYA